MHRVVRHHLESCLDRSVLPASRREVEAHLENCPACRQELEEARLTHEWMESLVSESLDAAPGFYQRVRSRVEAEGNKVWPFWQLLPAFSRQLSFAMVTLLLLLSGYFVTLSMTERRGGTSAELLDVPGIRLETPVLNADTHVNRERVMFAIMAPLGVEGD